MLPVVPTSKAVDDNDRLFESSSSFRLDLSRPRCRFLAFLTRSYFFNRLNDNPGEPPRRAAVCSRGGGVDGCPRKGGASSHGSRHRLTAQVVQLCLANIGTGKVSAAGRQTLLEVARQSMEQAEALRLQRRPEGERDREWEEQAEKGLENPAGANNCFLNVVLQALWHLPFRPGPHDCVPPCLVCALAQVFEQFSLARLRAVSPAAARQALAALFADRFPLGGTADAEETLGEVLGRAGAAAAPFRLAWVEQTHCACGGAGEPVPGTAWVQHMHAAGGLHLAPPPALACSCGRRGPPRRHLLAHPGVLTLAVVWPPAPALADIAAVLAAFPARLALDSLFVLAAPAPTYRLAGLVCYYGHHYIAYFMNPTTRLWVMFDDVVVRPVSADLAVVRERLTRGHFQPQLLFYLPEDPTQSLHTQPPLQNGAANHHPPRTPLTAQLHPIQSHPPPTQPLHPPPNYPPPIQSQPGHQPVLPACRPAPAPPINYPAPQPQCQPHAPAPPPYFDAVAQNIDPASRSRLQAPRYPLLHAQNPPRFLPHPEYNYKKLNQDHLL